MFDEDDGEFRTSALSVRAVWGICRSPCAAPQGKGTEPFRLAITQCRQTDLPAGRRSQNPVKPSREQYSSFQNAKSTLWSPRSVPIRGVRVVTNVERNALDVRRIRGRRSRVVLARPCRRQVRAGDLRRENATSWIRHRLRQKRDASTSSFWRTPGPRPAESTRGTRWQLPSQSNTWGHGSLSSPGRRWHARRAMRLERCRPGGASCHLIVTAPEDGGPLSRPPPEP
jgi:hypothetical protein